MQSVGTKNTGPELAVRQLLHRLGFRFRLHRKDLPGKPDIVFPGRRKVIFVHGCFWHRHSCPKGRLPKSRLDYWEPKLAQNVTRDHANVTALQALGWDVLTLWQCELRDTLELERRLQAFLNKSESISIDFSDVDLYDPKP